ncbi:MAG: phage terminase large subunit [Bacteroidales bacterium]|nr:phage terminase large subunit [Bacteroidales bacterium]
MSYTFYIGKNSADFCGMNIERSEQYKEWQRSTAALMRSVHGGGSSTLTETREAKEKRIERARRDYPYFVQTYFPHIARCKSGRFQTDAAKYILEHPKARAVFEWARGHAKSTHMGVFVPLWLKIQKERQFNTMVLVSKSEDSAVRLLADLQQELAYNELYISDYGQQIKEGNWAEGEFITADGCYFTALGRGQSPRGLKNSGRRPDYIVIDDIDDDEMVRNEKRTRLAAEWVLSALFGTMEAGRGRFIMVGNRIAKKSILTMITERPGVHHTVVNILDRNGKPTWSENYTPDEVAEMRSMMGERNFQKEYMNNPMTEGAVFRPEQIRYGKMLKLTEYRAIISYTDPSFKSTTKNDFKATLLVGLTYDGRYHVLKSYCAQTSVSEMIRWHYEIEEIIDGRVSVTYYIEANFIQDTLLDEFTKVGDEVGYHIPIIGDKRKKQEKEARIEGMQPLFERGLVIFNEKEKDTPGMIALVDQLLLFERGSRAHDDGPDALESAIWKLNRLTKKSTAKFRVIRRTSRKW